jgi:hypothetical protein
MKIKIIDPSHVQHIRTFKRMTKTATVDFVTWAQDGALPVAPSLNIATKPGLVILNDLTAETLAGLTDDLLDKRIMSVELSVDFAPPRSLPLSIQAEHLMSTYWVLFQRLAPWRNGLIGDRVYRTRKAGRNEGEWVLPRVDRNTNAGAAMGPLHSGYWSPPLYPTARAGTIDADTVYYGHKLQDADIAREGDSVPRAAVRLYIKVTNQNGPIPRSRFTTRVEITLSGAAIAEEIGVRTLRDLQTAPLNLLVSKFLPLVRPQPDKSVRHPVRPRRLPPPLASFVMQARQNNATAAMRRFVVEGASSVRDESGVEFRSVPELEENLKRPLQSYRSNVRRHRDRAAGPSYP